MEKGFTLIELLIVMAVIGLMAAIAVPQIALYRARAFDSRANSDLRNAVTAQETAYVDNSAYVDCTDSGCNSPVLPGFVISPSTELRCTSSAAGQLYTCTARNPGGSRSFTYDHATAEYTSAR